MTNPQKNELQAFFCLVVHEIRYCFNSSEILRLITCENIVESQNAAFASSFRVKQFFRRIGFFKMQPSQHCQSIMYGCVNQLCMDVS